MKRRRKRCATRHDFGGQHRSIQCPCLAQQIKAHIFAKQTNSYKKLKASIKHEIYKQIYMTTMKDIKTYQKLKMIFSKLKVMENLRIS